MQGNVFIIAIAAICTITIRDQGLNELIVAVILALIYLTYKHRTNRKLLIGVAVTCLLFFIHPIHFEHPPSLQATNVLHGKIVSIPIHDGNKLAFRVKTKDQARILVNYFSSTEHEKNTLLKLKYGMTCSFEGQYRVPPEPRNYYSFNYRQYLARNNIHFIFSTKTISLSNCKDERLNSYDRLQRFRQSSIEKINQHFPEQSRGMLIALIFGDRRNIDPETLQQYQKFGIIHLLAISGLHVGLVTAAVYYTLIRVGVTKEKALELLLMILPLYAIIAGGAPSVIRATLMTMAFLIATRWRFRVSPLDGISFVCLIVLLVNPHYLFHLGFQLSFLISFCLIVSATVIFRKFANYFAQLFAVTTIAQICSFPIIIYHFYEISLWSIPLNIIFVPFVSLIILPMSFITVVVSIFSDQLADKLVIVYNFLITLSEQLLLIANQLPYQTLRFGQPPLLMIVFYYAAIGIGLVLFEKANRRNQYVTAIVPFVMVALIHWNLPYFTTNGEVTMLDVGQGDSIYIELPRRQAVYLIDTGGQHQFQSEDEWRKRKKTFDVGHDIVVPFLKAKGVRKIDKLILTHGHYDHIGGAMALIDEQIKVRHLHYSYGRVEGEFERELLQRFSETNTNIHFVKRGERWQKGASHFYVLSPFGDEQSLNDRSIVIYANIGGLQWLFTGDLEAFGEQRLVRAHESLPIDVLKVGHHGSNTSTTNEFLKATKPRVALIPVGTNNRYGHPHDEVMKRLNNNDVSLILRTDEHGAIKYQFRKDKPGFFDCKLSKE